MQANIYQHLFLHFHTKNKGMIESKKTVQKESFVAFSGTLKLYLALTPKTPFLGPSQSPPQSGENVTKSCKAIFKSE